jgi:hypothetical protein
VEDRGALQQRDTYFHAVQGRLKLREEGGGPAELISSPTGSITCTIRQLLTFGPPRSARR